MFYNVIYVVMYVEMNKHKGNIQRINCPLQVLKSFNFIFQLKKKSNKKLSNPIQQMDWYFKAFWVGQWGWKVLPVVLIVSTRKQHTLYYWVKMSYLEVMFQTSIWQFLLKNKRCFFVEWKQEKCNSFSHTLFVFEL